MQSTVCLPLRKIVPRKIKYINVTAGHRDLAYLGVLVEEYLNTATSMDCVGGLQNLSCV